MSSNRSSHHRERSVAHGLFVLPSLVLYTVFSVFPILLGLYYSFTDWNGLTGSFHFTGLANYVRLFQDPRFFRVIRFSVHYTLLLMACELILGVAIALLLNQSFRARGLIRSVYFFPAVIGMLPCGLIFNQLFGHGLPILGRLLSIPALQGNILADPDLAIYGVLFVNVWQGVAIPTVLVLAGLQTIPAELVETARLDGAGRLQVFAYITMPFLLPTVSILLVMGLKDGLMVYDYVLALTSGGPAGRTESLTMLIMKLGFDEQKFSYGISVSVFVSTVIATISQLQIRLFSRRNVY